MKFTNFQVLIVFFSKDKTFLEIIHNSDLSRACKNMHREVGTSLLFYILLYFLFGVVKQKGQPSSCPSNVFIRGAQKGHLWLSRGCRVPFSIIYFTLWAKREVGPELARRSQGT